MHCHPFRRVVAAPHRPLVFATLIAIPALLPISAFPQSSDVIPPSAPTGLTATVATCGQVNLSWSASTDEIGGSGLKAYTINRYNSSGANTPITIGAARTTFSDTNWVQSSAAVTYTVVAMDNAGNVSTPSNSVAVSTPACPVSSMEQIIDTASQDVLGKTMAVYGSRTALIYTKANAQLTYDTWLYIHDDDTGQASRFLLHAFPGYHQIESDYVLTSATELWTLSYDMASGGTVLASQYKLNGSPVSSATLLSTRSLGDGNSHPKSMMRLKSGALMMAWNEEGYSYTTPDGSLNTGFAYRSAAGNWTVNFPLNIPNPYGGNISRTEMAMAQHPADGSIWAFAKRDSFNNINALHLTETASGFLVDWINPGYITVSGDGNNGPEVEFPFLSAAADPTRNAVLLAYQSHPYQIVFIDPLFNYTNGIFLKESNSTIAQIGSDGAKSFIPFNTTMERAAQFGFSVLADGTIWLTYQPINHTTLTWNQVYASQYSGAAWSAPTLVGTKYMSANVGGAARDPGFVVSRTDQPHVAFWTPDQKIHTFVVSNSAAPPPPSSDTTPPMTSITSPADGGTVSGVVAVAASASDNIGVARVDLQIDGVVKGSLTAPPYTFSWDTGTAAPGKHTLQAVAYDAAGNIGTSAPVTETVLAAADTVPPAVAITSPASGGTVPRNTAITIASTATDNVGVSKVQLYVNNTLIGTDTGAPYNFSWKVPPKNNATYTIKVVAYDAAGNSAMAASTVTAQ